MSELMVARYQGQQLRTPKWALETVAASGLERSLSLASILVLELKSSLIVRRRMVGVHLAAGLG